MSNSNAIVIHKGRQNTIQVNTGLDLTSDTVTSEIRSEPELGAPQLGEFTVTKVNTGSDGKLLLTISAVVTGQITADVGFMDLKRLSSGVPLSIFSEPLEVVFQGSVTE